jgi:nondiscriminating glutamyl-tRNA synthetase
MKRLSEINELSDHMFKEINYDKELLRWKDMTDEELSQSLDIIINTLHKIDNWNLENLEKEIISEAEKTGNRGGILWPMRVALSGKKASAGPLEIANILGKEKTIKLIENAKKKI